MELQNSDIELSETLKNIKPGSLYYSPSHIWLWKDKFCREMPKSNIKSLIPKQPYMILDISLVPPGYFREIVIAFKIIQSQEIAWIGIDLSAVRTDIIPWNLSK